MKRALLTLSLLLQACAASAPVTHEYLLRDSTTAVTPPAGTAEVTLNAVRMAPYLDRPGIVVEVAPLQIAEARYERWAEPLGLALRRVLQVEIARAAGVTVVAAAGGTDSDLSVDVSVHEFHGAIDGTVRLVADWTLLSRQGEGRHLQFSRTEQTSADGYAAVVASQLSLARQLGASIGQSIASYRRAAQTATPR